MSELISKLGNYDIVSTIGQGGMGIVYKAVDSNLGREVAIKVLHPHLLRHENLKQRFRREARMHAKLMHPNIVTLLSLYEDDSHMALIMELVEGNDLKVYLRNNPSVSLKTKLKIAIDVLSGLEAAHKFGMVHRDLKPANVLVSNQGEAKLLDFGLAKPEQGDDDLTQSGATVGSFRYMSPEQILNNPIDARTDLYAFGILLFYMTVGKLPFDSTSNGGEFEIMEKQVREPAPAPHTLNSAIPRSLSKLILNLLEKNKYERPASAAVVKDAVLNIINELDNQNQPEPATPQVLTEEPQHYPDDLTVSYSNQEVMRQWVQYIQDKWKIFSAGIKQLLNKYSLLLRHRLSGLAGITTIFILLGISAIIVLSMAGNPETPNSTAKTPVHEITEKSDNNKGKDITTDAPQVEAVTKTPVTVEKTPEKAEPPAVTEPAPKPVVKAEPKPQPKPKPKKVKVLPVTYSVKYSVTRSDKTKVDNKEHEFKGGDHLFYPGLAKKGWFESSETGETVITFQKPIRVSTIILHKASVGDLDFSKSYIYLEIKGPGDKNWRQLFERKDDDLDTRLTFRRVYKHKKEIESVRVRFKTYEPITIGPIDIYK